MKLRARFCEQLDIGNPPEDTPDAVLKIVANMLLSEVFENAGGEKDLFTYEKWVDNHNLNAGGKWVPLDR